MIGYIWTLCNSEGFKESSYIIKFLPFWRKHPGFLCYPGHCWWVLLLFLSKFLPHLFPSCHWDHLHLLLCNMHYAFDAVFNILCNPFEIFHAVWPHISPAVIDSSLLDAIPGCASIISNTVNSDWLPVVRYGGFLTGVKSLKSSAIKLPGVVCPESFYYAEWGVRWKMQHLGAWRELLHRGGHFRVLCGNELEHYPKLTKPWRQSFCLGNSIQLLGLSSCGTNPRLFRTQSMLLCSTSSGLAYSSGFSLYVLVAFVLCVPLRVCTPWHWHIIARLHGLCMI